MFSGDVQLELVLLDKLRRTVLALGWFFSRVLETEGGSGVRGLDEQRVRG